MSIGMWQIALLGLVLVLLFGSRRLPALGAELARGLKDFKGQLEGQFSAARARPGEDAPFEEPEPKAGATKGGIGPGGIGRGGIGPGGIGPGGVGR